ncbi:hypothetical protein ACFDR8_003855 [Arthrobacter sp. MP_2.3]
MRLVTTSEGTALEPIVLILAIVGVSEFSV